ncbi:C3 and PZP alpha-2-macroglobulin domain-containing protein 8 [Danaus plexippus plexippus]|uniref:C3 and PZP alpha-2-macroglobulin domain-containing protein 8 n=1 Tax=Danaus plexippus plexippus TaxID=278856 RepID=A0A212FKM2_DANPL|nr:C3 and PZP alpha-2-macroglobulin domain-containing protein 8 [Danaus plexippus plexippus]
MANILDVATEDNLQYHFFPIASGSVQFKIRSPNDAHIALTMGPQESDPMVEIFIGGWGNTKSVIRRNRTKPEKAEIDTPNILNGGEFRGFWVRWDGGIISAGREGEAIPFISWQDPEPFPIGFVGVCTGWGASGTWKIEDGAEFNTPDKLEYKFGPVAAGSLEFEYRGPHNCHVCLTSAPAEIDPMYEVILGGWENTQSVIRHCRQKPDKVTVPTPSLMNANEFRKFIFEWRCGRLTVRDGGTGAILMEWVDPTPFPVLHFGVRTGYGARGNWRISHFYKGNAQPLPPPPSAPSAAALYSPPPGYPGVAPVPGSGASGVWVDATSGLVPPGAVVGGQDCSGEALYVARAQHEGALLPGKLVGSHGCAYVPWGGQEHGKPEYQVLVGGPNNWIATSGSNIPPGALPGGQSEDGETLYVGRVNHEGSITTGKVQQSHGVCYISFGGQELGFPDYEVLVQ